MDRQNLCGLEREGTGLDVAGTRPGSGSNRDFLERRAGLGCDPQRRALRRSAAADRHPAMSLIEGIGKECADEYATKNLLAGVALNAGRLLGAAGLLARYNEKASGPANRLQVYLQWQRSDGLGRRSGLLDSRRRRDHGHDGRQAQSEQLYSLARRDGQKFRVACESQNHARWQFGAAISERAVPERRAVRADRLSVRYRDDE